MSRERDPDFSLAYVYQFYHPDNEELFYVGSSCQPEAVRSSHHKYTARHESFTSQLYVTMRQSENIDSWVMTRLESFPCENNDQLRQREEHWRVTLNAPLNTNRCYRTEEQKKEDRRAYYETRKEEERAYSRAYRDTHKEEIRSAHRSSAAEAVEKKTYYCDVCKYAATNKANLKSHLTTKKHLDAVAKLAPRIETTTTIATTTTTTTVTIRYN